MLRGSLVLLACAACTSVPQPLIRSTDNGRPGSAIDVATAGALEAKEIADGPQVQTAYGWHLEFAGGRARYFVCTAADACTFRQMDLNADAVRATKVVTRARPTREDGTGGDEVDVYELKLVRDDTTTRGGIGGDGRGGLLVR